MIKKTLPCPFCGSVKQEWLEQGFEGQEFNWSILCDCGVSTGGYETKDKAIAFWNNRASPNSFAISSGVTEPAERQRSYTVNLTCSHTVTIFAEDEEDARDKAEACDWVEGSDMSPSCESIESIEEDL